MKVKDGTQKKGNKKVGLMPRRLTSQRRFQRRPRVGFCHKIAGEKLSLVSKQRIFREDDIHLGKEDRLVMVAGWGGLDVGLVLQPPAGPHHLHAAASTGKTRRWATDVVEVAVERWFILTAAKCAWVKMRGDNVLAKVCQCASGMNLHEMRLSRVLWGNVGVFCFFLRGKLSDIHKEKLRKKRRRFVSTTIPPLPSPPGWVEATWSYSNSPPLHYNMSRK